MRKDDLVGILRFQINTKMLIPRADYRTRTTSTQQCFKAAEDSRAKRLLESHRVTRQEGSRSFRIFVQ